MYFNETIPDLAPSPAARDLPVRVQSSVFRGSGGVEEFHYTLEPTAYGTFAEQLSWLEQAYEQLFVSPAAAHASVVFRRFFCSDLINQAPLLNSHSISTRGAQTSPCAVSWVEQAPRPPARVALWAYHIVDPKGALNKSGDASCLVLDRNELRHAFTAGLQAPSEKSSFQQTHEILADYTQQLQRAGLSWSRHVARTWFFMPSIDADYAGFVSARNEVFAREHLTADTHFIASTGIAGGADTVTGKVLMDAYAIGDLRPGQTEYLQALDHLSPTALYGVSFERATAITYQDRKHIFISGTASIDACGEIVAPGDVLAQFNRILENIDALLQAGGGQRADLRQAIVYLRDPADVAAIDAMMLETLPQVPFVVVTAAVCRPGWLVEIEGIALVAEGANAWPAF